MQVGVRKEWQDTRRERNKNQKDNNPIPLFLSLLLCQPRLHFVALFSQDTFFDTNSLLGKLIYTWLRRDVCEWCVSHEYFCISELSRVERVINKTHKGGRWHRNMEHRSRYKSSSSSGSSMCPNRVDSCVVCPCVVFGCFGAFVLVHDEKVGSQDGIRQGMLR